MTFTEAEARSKHCPIQGYQCVASGCMFWRKVPGFMRDIKVDWPADIPRPARLETRDAREDAIEFSRAARKALEPMVGGTYGDTGETIVRTYPIASDLMHVGLQLEKEPCGQCAVRA